MERQENFVRNMYGGGADDRVEHHGGMGGSSMCPRGSVYRMDELRELLMPPRGSVLLLGGATSSSIIRGDLETECLLEELNDGAFDDHVFLGKTLVAIFHIVVALTHNECTGGCLPVGKNTQGKNMDGGVYYMNFLFYFCWRVVSEVHKLGWILAPRVYGFLNMQPPINVKLN
jgi:hypothetical protein